MPLLPEERFPSSAFFPIQWSDLKQILVGDFERVRRMLVSFFPLLLATFFSFRQAFLFIPPSLFSKNFRKGKNEGGDGKSKSKACAGFGAGLDVPLYVRVISQQEREGDHLVSGKQKEKKIEEQEIRFFHPP